MLYCDKCRNHLMQRSIRGCNIVNHSFEPFTLDLCAKCYNEFRTTVRNWLNSQVWAEADAQAHSNETSVYWTK